MSLNLATLLRGSAKRYPTKPAIHVNDVVLPYQLVDGMAQRFAGALRALGVTAGQHVAVMLPNVPRFTIAYYGCRYAANPVVPLNVLLTADEIAYRLGSDAVAGRLGGSYEAARAGFDRVASCKHILVAKADRADMTAPEGALNFTATAMAAQPIGGVPATSPDDTAVILYTSGTTGRPKGAELSHINLLYNADVMSQLPSRVPADQQVVLVVLPLFHSFGQTVMQNCAIRGGGTMVLMPRFEPLGAAQRSRSTRSRTSAACRPCTSRSSTIPRSSPRCWPASRSRCRAARRCRSGHERLRPEVQDRHPRGLRPVGDLAGGVVQPAGQEEARLDRHAAGGIEMKLVGADGKDVHTFGDPGEICIEATT